MRHFRRILFPIALSEAAIAMASSVREIAQRFNAVVTVLNACNLAPEYLNGPAPDAPCDSNEKPILFSPALQEMRNQQEWRLEEFARTHFSGIGHKARIEIGDPAAVIENHQRGERTHTEKLIEALGISHRQGPACLLEKGGNAAAVLVHIQ